MRTLVWSVPEGGPVRPAPEDERDQRGPSNIEVVPGEPFEERPATGRVIEDAGVGDLELTEGHLIDITGPQIWAGERGGQAHPPAPYEALRRPGPNRSQIRCEALGSEQDWNPLSRAAYATRPSSFGRGTLTGCTIAHRCAVSQPCEQT